MNKINKLNTESSDKFLKSISTVGAWTGLSRIFGLIRDISTTSLLGASVFHDIFVITLKIPNMFRRFFAEGAFNQAFVPIYADFQKNNDFDFFYYRFWCGLLGYCVKNHWSSINIFFNEIPSLVCSHIWSNFSW